MTDRRDEAPRAIDQAEPGFFLLRLVKAGPLVAARISHDGGIWRAIIDGVAQEPGAADWTHAAGVDRIWTAGRRCTESEYRYRLALRAHALTADPDHPAANPTKPIRLRNLRPVF